MSRAAAEVVRLRAENARLVRERDDAWAVVDDLRRMMVQGWRVQTDCGPCVRLVQDQYEPHKSGAWVCPDRLGLARYCAPEDFGGIAVRLLALAEDDLARAALEGGEK